MNFTFRAQGLAAVQVFNDLDYTCELMSPFMDIYAKQVPDRAPRCPD